MKLGAVTPVYNEEKLIRGCVESLKPFVDRHIILVSEKPYYGEAEPLDNTGDIAEDLGAIVIYGVWPLDHHQRNDGIKLLHDCDWIICTDADMWIEREQMEKLIHRLENSEAESLIIRQKSYFKDIEHRICDDGFMPVIAVKPNIRFSYIGNVDCPVEIINDIYIHHLSWCEPKDIRKKVLTYSHAPEFNGEQWYNNVYLRYSNEEYVELPDRRYKIELGGFPDELKKYIN